MAQERRLRDEDEDRSVGDQAETGEYDVSEAISEAIKKGKAQVLEEKEKLAVKEKSEEEIEEELVEEELEARREVYEQEIVEDAAMQRPITTLERQLQRERFRRDIMARAGREARAPFKLRKRFHMKASETYDDNIYLTKLNKKVEYVSRISPSALFSISSKVVSMDVNYVVDITRYKNRKDLSGTNHLLLTYIRPGSLALPFPHKRGGKIGIEVQDDFQPLVTSVATSEQTDRTDRTFNRFFLAVDYYMSAKRTLALEYANTYEHYKGTTLKSYSYTQQLVSPTFYFHIRPRWSLFTGYEYQIIDYSKGTQDSTSNRLKGGISGTFLKKVLARFEGGKEWRTYRDSTHGEAQTMFFKTALMDKFTPATTSSIEYEHSISESQYTSNTYFMSDNIDFNIQHSFTFKTTGKFGMKYILNTYDKDTTEDGETGKRQDHLWQPSLGLKYYMKRWLSFDLDYYYKMRKSNFKKFNYVDNTVVGAVNIGF